MIKSDFEKTISDTEADEEAAQDAYEQFKGDAQKSIDDKSDPELKGSIGEGPNHSNFSEQSSVKIVSEIQKILLEFIRRPKNSGMFNIEYNIWLEDNI